MSQIKECTPIDSDAVDTFREYLRIPTVHPDINYDECIAFLKKQADSLELPYQIFHCAPTKPIFIITWQGKEPTLPSIWLGSHTDVVPVFEDLWTYPPFGADMDAEGNIYARGAQDMKSVGIQYLEAVRRLKREGVKLKRTVHIAFIPEEEVNGVDGMQDFSVTDDFRKFNVGFALDEGAAHPTEEFIACYGERFIWQIRVRCPGQQGHGSILTPHPPGNAFGVIVRKFNEFRAQELQKLSDDPTLNMGDVTTINLTVVEGGVKVNVVPPEFTATYDMRIATTVDPDELEAMLNGWCKEAGEGVTIEFTSKDPKVPNTKIDDSNAYWVAFKKATEEMKMKLLVCIFPGATDARFLRKLGIPAIGFSPMNHTPILAHDNDEYVNVDVFLEGINIYEKIIPAIANAD